MGQRGVFATQPPPKVTDPFRARSVECNYKSFPTTMAPLSRARNGRCAIRGQARENSDWSTQLDVAAYRIALKLRAQGPRAQGGGADKKAGRRGNEILPYL